MTQPSGYLFQLTLFLPGKGVIAGDTYLVKKLVKACRVAEAAVKGIRHIAHSFRRRWLRSRFSGRLGLRLSLLLIERGA